MRPPTTCLWKAGTRFTHPHRYMKQEEVANPEEGKVTLPRIPGPSSAGPHLLPPPLLFLSVFLPASLKASPEAWGRLSKVPRESASPRLGDQELGLYQVPSPHLLCTLGRVCKSPLGSLRPASSIQPVLTQNLLGPEHFLLISNT